MATGTSVSAYRIAQLTPGTPSAPGNTAGSATPSPPALRKPAPVLLHRSLRADHRGRVRLTLRCKPLGLRCRGGVLVLRAALAIHSGRAGHRVRRYITITVARGAYRAARGDFVVTLQLGPGTRAQLQSRPKSLALRVAITANGAGVREFNATLERERQRRAL